MNYQYHRKSMRLVLFHNVCRCWETYSNLKLTFKLWAQTCLSTIMSAFHQCSLYTAFGNERQIFSGITGNYHGFIIPYNIQWLCMGSSRWLTFSSPSGIISSVLALSTYIASLPRPVTIFSILLIVYNNLTHIFSIILLKNINNN